MTYTPHKWVNGKKPAINAENLNAMDEAIARLFEMASVPDITTTTSTTQPSSYAGREHILEIGGVTEQETTEGNQLFDISTFVNNQYFNSSTQAIEANAAWGISDYIAVDGTKYVISQKETNFFQVQVIEFDASKNYLSIKYYGNTTKYFPITLISENTAYVRINYSLVVDSAKVNRDEIMLNKGTTVLPYEKYTGGIPAPNPSYPMEIKKTVVSGVKTHHENSFDADSARIGVAWNDNVSTTRATVVVPCKPNTTYTISCDTSKFELVTWFEKTNVHDATVVGSVNITGVNTATTNAKANFIIVQFNKENVALADIKSANVMLNEGNTALPYKPHQSSSATLSQPIELYGMNGVQDIFTPKQTKRKFVTRRLTGNEDGFAVSSVYKGSFYFSCVDIGGKPQAPYFCTHAIYKGTDATNFVYGTCISNGDTYNLWLFEEQKTVEEIREYLANNEVYITYELAEETTEALPIADQIALNSLATYDGITYVEFDAEIQPTFKAEYGTSKVGGYTLEALLAGRNGELK